MEQAISMLQNMKFIILCILKIAIDVTWQMISNSDISYKVNVKYKLTLRKWFDS